MLELIYMPYEIPQLERDHWHAFFFSVCTHDNTGVPEVFCPWRKAGGKSTDVLSGGTDTSHREAIAHLAFPLYHALILNSFFTHLCSFLLIHVLQQYRKLASVEPCQHPMMNSSAVKSHQCTFVVPHHLSTTLTLPKRTHPVCSRKHCNPSPCLLLQHTTQDRHRLPARLKGGTQKVVRQGETRQIRWRAHLCGIQEVL